MILQGFAAIMNPACMGLIIVGTIVGIFLEPCQGLQLQWPSLYACLLHIP